MCHATLGLRACESARPIANQQRDTNDTTDSNKGLIDFLMLQAPYLSDPGCRTRPTLPCHITSPPSKFKEAPFEGAFSGRVHHPGFDELDKVVESVQQSRFVDAGCDVVIGFMFAALLVCLSWASIIPWLQHVRSVAFAERRRELWSECVRRDIGAPLSPASLLELCENRLALKVTQKGPFCLLLVPSIALLPTFWG